jgi:hypothetical protein
MRTVNIYNMDTNTSVGDRKMPGRAYGISSDLCMAGDYWINGSGEDVQTVKQCMYPTLSKRLKNTP